MMYNNIKELKFKINKLNTDFRKYRQIKKKGYIIVKKHSYVERAKFLLKVIYE